jgi:RHS repeat-associated protein
MLRLGLFDRSEWRSAKASVLGLAVVLAGVTPAIAQVGQTPPALTPGAPAGSYALSDLEHVNLFNGNLQVRLPLVEARGRGELTVGVSLPIEQQWRAEEADPGIFFPRFNWWRFGQPGYGPGYLVAYRDGQVINGDVLIRVTRIVFVGPGGTQHEMRDVPNNVYPDDGQYCVVDPNEPCSRGFAYQTRDGEGMTFVSETEITDYITNLALNGHLMFRDGTRYRIQNNLVTEMRDRNGNLFKFTYVSPPDHDDYAYAPFRGVQPQTITDSLNRTISFTYAQPYHPTSNPVPADTITFKGFGGAVRTIRVEYQKLAAALVEGQPLTLPGLFPGIGWGDTKTPHNPMVVSSVVLPDARRYTLRYNPFGELADMTLPTGGRTTYTYGGPPPDGNHIVRRVLARVVSPDGVTATQKTVYGGEEGFPDPASPDQIVTVDDVDPQNGDALLRRTNHYYFGRAGTSFLTPVQLPSWRIGREFRTDILDGAGVQLRQIDHLWVQDNSAPFAPTMNPRIIETTTTLSDSGQRSRKIFTHDDYNNVLTTTETDFSFGGQETYLRRTETDYVTWYTPVGGHPTKNYATDPAIHIRNLPLQKRVLRHIDGNWHIRAMTTFVYDNYTNDGVHASLFTYGSSLTGLDPAFAGGYPNRGNLTTTQQWLDDPAGLVEMHQRFATTGNVVASVDARGNETTFQYAEHFGAPSGSVTDDTTPPELAGGAKTHAFPTIVTNALGHTTQTQIDYYLGQPIDTQDANSTIFTASFADALDRPTELIRAHSATGPDPCVGGGHPERHRQRFVYNDAARFVRTRHDRNALCDDLQRSEKHFDGIGREVEVRTYELEGATASQDEYVAVRRTYDALGRIRQVSNPFRVKPSGSETPVWTTTTYDALSRPYDVVGPDGQVVPTRYLGSTTTVTDQAGKARRTALDALDRVVAVVESPDTLDFQTTYSHDPVGGVETVVQGGQSRAFTYDSLGRLRTQTTPEGGLVRYTYDPNGNVREREDARVRIVYDPYDKLNRPTRKRYVPALSPEVTYTYDDLAAGLAKGRLTRVTNGVSMTDYLGYDRLGRIGSSRQTTQGAPYAFAYGYDLAGNLTSRTYPSGRTITTNYDRSGRFTSVQQIVPTSIPFADNASYAAHGALTRLRLGNQRWESTSIINNRLQPERMGVGTSQGATDVYQLDYTYNSPGQSDNNGNLRSQTIRHTSFAPFTQSYSYDDVNRLHTAGEPGAWSQTYDYDPYGNRAVTQNAGHVLSDLTPEALVDFDGKNQIVASDYDGTGNQTRDALNRVFGYDGENRQVSYIAPGAPEVTYTYDGEGRRVSRQQGAGQRVFVYDAFGLLAAEYLTAAPTGTGLQYSTPDHLGSVRLVTDASGAVVSRHDFLPFGEEIASNLGTRASIGGYGALDGFRQRFSGKERDNETGLDFFGARYHSGPQGRFTTPDPALGTAFSDPQRWNRYAYVRGNPLRLVDPNGTVDKPALDQSINKVLASDPGLLDVIKNSNNFSQRSFEEHLAAGSLSDLTTGAGATLRGLSGEAVALDHLKENTCCGPTRLFLHQPNFKVLNAHVGNPDILAFRPTGRLGIYNVHNVIENAVFDAFWTHDVTLPLQVQGAFYEVKTGHAYSTMKEGANQATATAQGLRAHGFNGSVSILMVDADAYNALSLGQRRSLYLQVMNANGFIQLVKDLNKKAEERANDMLNRAKTREGVAY